MYSQGKEEESINRYFKGRTGRFLDIGAFDGKIFSNSLRLVELGWSGVCVEPSPKPFACLDALHKDNPAVETIKALIGPTNGPVTFYDSDGDAVSTTDLAHKKKWEKGSKIKFNQIEVEGMTAKTLLDKVGRNFDFVNIDTENTNVEILKNLIANGMRFELLCIEHDNQHSQIVSMFPKCQPIFQNAENLIIYYKDWPDA